MVEVCATHVGGLASFTLAGRESKVHAVVEMEGQAAKELRIRVRSALVANGCPFPGRVAVALSGCAARGLDARLDLPIAVSIALALRSAQANPLEGHLLVGELSLAGELRPVRGVLLLAEAALAAGLHGLVVPLENAQEAALVPGLRILPVGSLRDVLAHLSGEREVEPFTGEPLSPRPAHGLDMGELPGLEAEKAALEVAVAGGHGVLMAGPAGSGMVALAQRLATIMPEVSQSEVMEIARVWSVVGLTHEGRHLNRPFRAPHYTISEAGLVGGGVRGSPGEVSLAHNGVLFLDELTEFRKVALESLHCALRDKEITLGSASATVRYPSHTLPVATMRPCPCGWNRVVGGNALSCHCSEASIQAHWARQWAFLQNHLQVRMRMSPPQVSAAQVPALSSSHYRARVEAARARQRARFAGSHLRLNADISPSFVRTFCLLSPAAFELLETEADLRGGMTANTDCALQGLALTCADLEGHEEITEVDMQKAIVLHADPREAP
jgi:magnesium chelatase family protein